MGNIDSGSPEAIARDLIAERGFADTLRELETLKRTDRESRDEWLKSWGFGLFAVLKHGPIGEVLSLLQDGWISRGKAAEAMAEIMLGNKPNLPESKSSTFDDFDIPGEVVTELKRCAFELSNDKDMALGKLDQALTEHDAARAEAAMLREALELSVCTCALEGEKCQKCTALSTPADDWLERKIQEALEQSTNLKMYVWSHEPLWVAVAHGRSVKEARELMTEYMGTGDGSCVVREKARAYVQTQAPSIWVGPNVEFALTDSAELQEQEAYSATLLARAEKAEAEREELAAALYRFGPCPMCGGYGTEVELVQTPLSPDGEECTAPCVCGGINPAAILSAHDARIRSEARKSALLEASVLAGDRLSQSAGDIYRRLVDLANDEDNHV